MGCDPSFESLVFGGRNDVMNQTVRDAGAGGCRGEQGVASGSGGQVQTRFALFLKSNSLWIVRALIDAFTALLGCLAPKVDRETFGCEQMRCEVRADMRPRGAASQQPSLGYVIFAVNAVLVKLL